ncbi:hypothetical protein KJ636_00390 [Patescibacteria group bacterium]|nr:hypothetical protein [Patescibacteria group bacterium]MBU4481612.1 hypothetical protein [Patescibacteria group bacterium]
MQKIKSVFLAGLPAIVIATLLVVAIIYAWTEPTSAPPAGNVSAPINVGLDPQTKSGNLGIGGLFRAMGSVSVFDGNVGIGTTTPSGLLDVGGGKLVVLSGGNVGIGTPGPGSKLEVSGSFRVTGTSSYSYRKTNSGIL